MFKRIIKRNIRRPLPCIAVCLFAAVLAFSLCYFHSSLEEERRSFELAYNSVPVTFKVTELDGGKVNSKDGIHGFIGDLFLKNDMPMNFSELSKDLQLRMEHNATFGEQAEGKLPSDFSTVAGITSLYVAKELTPERGGSIRWYEGFDESVFRTDELVCIVSESFTAEDEAVLTFASGAPENKKVTHTFRIVGRYTDMGNKNIYCPYYALQRMFSEMGQARSFRYIEATLKDNNDIELLRESAAQWFAEPNPSGMPTPWGKFGYDNYLFALDIDDSLLKILESDMKNSIFMNTFASAIVFILSAGAGFLMGFLVIRSRKREIALMRTIGAPQKNIFGEISLEQLSCLAVGLLIGGAYSLWQPIDKLLLFGIIYYFGLFFALLIFLRKNLLTTIKEDE